MRFEILIQFIVPLTFLAIWALTTLLNREAQPLPPRPGRPAGLGPRPGGVLPARPERRVPAAQPPARTPPAPGLPGPDIGWTSGGGAPPPPRPRAGERPAPSLSDAIVFLEAEAPRSMGGAPRAAPSSGRASQRPSQSRRAGQGRTLDPAQDSQTRPRAPTQRALSDQMQESLALHKARPLEITPLSKPIKRLTRPLGQASAAAETAHDRGAPAAASLLAGEVRGLLSTPEQIRQAIILTEVLGPPLAFRRR